MSSICPPKRPQLSTGAIRIYLETREYAKGLRLRSLTPVLLLANRGYYLNSMGEPGANDRNLYDDAAWIITPNDIFPFNFNTDPSIYRKGRGFDDDTKGVAELKPGLWWYREGMHRGQYMAFVQAADVTVMRDGNPPYPDTGQFGINIHRGGYGTTSSLGCQTLPPDQWDEFHLRLVGLLKLYKITSFPYYLTEDVLQ